jgi:hypothetical protein
MGRVRTVERRAAGRFRVEVGGGHALVARRVLAAAGLADELHRTTGTGGPGPPRPPPQASLTICGRPLNAGTARRERR